MVFSANILDGCNQYSVYIGRSALVVCTGTHIFSGFIYRSYGERFLDTLNEGISFENSVDSRCFLRLNDVEVLTLDGRKENVSSIYVRRSKILFVAEKKGSQSVASWTDLPSRSSLPRQKIRLRARVSLPIYGVVGSMHYDIGNSIVDTLETYSEFVPMTNVEISPQLLNGESAFDFVAINRDQIIYINRLESIDPSKVLAPGVSADLGR